MLWTLVFVFVKQKTAYELRISDWSSDVCSSDLTVCCAHRLGLMPVQSDRLPACAEHGGRLPSQHGVVRQRLHRYIAREMRVDGDQRLGPEALARVDGLDPILNIARSLLGERPRETHVVPEVGTAAGRERGCENEE